MVDMLFFLLPLLHVCYTIPLPGLEDPDPTKSFTASNFQFPSFQGKKTQTVNNFQPEVHQLQQQVHTENSVVQNGPLDNNVQIPPNKNENPQSQIKGNSKHIENNLVTNHNVNSQDQLDGNTVSGDTNQSMLYALSHMSGLELLHYLGIKTPTFTSGSNNNIDRQRIQINHSNSGQTSQQQAYNTNNKQQSQNKLSPTHQQVNTNQQQLNSNNVQNPYNPNTVNLEQMHTNPAYMMAGGRKNQISNGNHVAQGQVPNQNLISNQVSNSGEMLFDPDQLMHSMMNGNESPFNPSTYNLKQNYIEAKGWQSFTGKTSSPGGSGTNKLTEGQTNISPTNNQQKTNQNQNIFNPNSVNGAKMNFQPVAMMMSPDGSKEKSSASFNFNPDKLNAFGGGFKPGQISPVKINQLQVPSNNDQKFPFNADLINKKLTDMDNSAYLPQTQQEQQQQQMTINQQQTLGSQKYDPNSSNTAGMNFFPKAFFSQFTDTSNFGTSTYNQNNHVKSVTQGTPGQSAFKTNIQQQAKENVTQQKNKYVAKSGQTQNAFSRLQSGISWGSMPSTYDKLFGEILFNEDAINQRQRPFDPDKVMQSWFEAHSITTLEKPSIGRSSPVAQLQQNELRKIQSVYDDSEQNVTGLSTSLTLIMSPKTTPSTKTKTDLTYIPMATTKSAGNDTSTMTTTVSPAMVTPITIPETNPTNTFTTTNPSTTTKHDQLVSKVGNFQAGFNPDAINSAMGQMNFSPGNILGYGQPPNMKQSGQYSSAFNPDSVNKVNFNSGGLNMMQNGYSTGQSNSGPDGKDNINHSGFSMTGTFNPAAVNQASMSFNLNQQMGLSSDSSGKQDMSMFPGMYDPMKTNIQSVKSPFITDPSNNSSPGSNNFFSGNGMMMMDNSAFSGTFDPYKVNKESIEKGFGSGKNFNNHSNGFMAGGNDYMKQFFGMGSNGVMDNSAFGGRFDPASVNKAVFDPNDVNNVHMNFNPSKMLEKNPGYDKSEAEKYTFDPNKVNDVKMNFIPPFMKSDKKDQNKTKSNTKTSDSEFVPGLLSGGGGSLASFNPNTVNNAIMHFSPMDVMNQLPSGSILSSDNSTNNQTPSATSTGGRQTGISFDPVAVNNGQMNFNPSAMMGNIAKQSTSNNGASTRISANGFEQNSFDGEKININPPFMSHSNTESLFNSFDSDGSHVIGGEENGE